jgi:hypothetical protein
MRISEQISFHYRRRSRESGADKVGRDHFVGLWKSRGESDLDPGHTPPCASCRPCQQISHAHQIVGCRGPSEDPSHSFQPSKPRLAQQGHGLEPTKDFLHPLALRLTYRVTGMPGGALINRTAAPTFRVLGHMRCNLQLAQRGHVLGDVIILVAAQSQPPSLLLSLRPTISSDASRSAVPVAFVSRVSTTRPWRFSIST